MVALLLLSFSGSVKAQSFRMNGKLGEVTQSGFYRIPLGPGVTSHLNDLYSDIRIYDEMEKETPYIMRSEVATASRQLFNEYAIIEKEHTPGCCTDLILHNPGKSRINNLSLIIRNADVTKRAKLSGSDDRNHWYVIKQAFYLEPVNSEDQTFEARILNFPLSDYEYYLLNIEDSSSAPLNILKAGYYDTFTEDGKYQILPAPSVRQKDSSDKRSYITITFPDTVYIDKLRVNLQGPLFYLREASLYLIEKNKKRTIQQFVSQGALRSNSENIFSLDHIKASGLCLIIDNKDNPPLKARSAVASELTRYLVAYLEKGREYHVAFGHPDIRYPDYDLGFFSDSIPQVIPALKISGISLAQNHPHTEKQPETSFFESTAWILTAIFLVALLLGLMTVRMMREMKKG